MRRETGRPGSRCRVVGRDTRAVGRIVGLERRTTWGGATAGRGRKLVVLLVWPMELDIGLPLAIIEYFVLSQALQAPTIAPGPASLVTGRSEERFAVGAICIGLAKALR